LSYHRASKAAPASGAASMTVCTNDLALCHLVKNALPFAIPNPLGNAELLVPEMIELEHDGIGLSAVDARMLAKERDQIFDAFGSQGSLSQLGLIDVSPTVGQVMLSLVLGAAWAAIVVPLTSCFPPPGKVTKRLFLPAAPTSPHIQGA
jgi:hypothetical protein